jgi:hypothetical protein
MDLFFSTWFLESEAVLEIPRQCLYTDVTLLILTFIPMIAETSVYIFGVIWPLVTVANDKHL